jgi:hypothetical protein
MEEGPGPDRGLGGVEGGRAAGRAQAASVVEVPVTAPEPVITGADGQPLSSDDEASMQAVVEFYQSSAGPSL